MLNNVYLYQHSTIAMTVHRSMTMEYSFGFHLNHIVYIEQLLF